MLVLSELTAKRPFLTLTFGLLAADDPRLAGHLVEHHAAEIDAHLRGRGAEARSTRRALIDDLAAHLANGELRLDEAIAALEP